MSRQYKRTRNKKQSGRIKPDSRFEEPTSAYPGHEENEHVENPDLKDGVWVIHTSHRSFGIGHIMFQHSKVDPDGTTRFIDLYRVKWKGGIDRDNTSSRIRPCEAEDDINKPLPNSFSVHDKVMDKRSVSGRVGVVVNNEIDGMVYVDWGNGKRLRILPNLLTSATDHYIHMDMLRMKGKPISNAGFEPGKKDPNPNRAFKFHKRGRAASRCHDCGFSVVISDIKTVKVPGRSVRVYCTACFNSRYGSSPKPLKKELCTALQRITIRDLANKKGVRTEADFNSLSNVAADTLINQWKTLPDINQQHKDTNCCICGVSCSSLNDTPVDNGFVCGESCHDIAERGT